MREDAQRPHASLHLVVETLERLRVPHVPAMLASLSVIDRRPPSGRSCLPPALSTSDSAALGARPGSSTQASPRLLRIIPLVEPAQLLQAVIVDCARRAIKRTAQAARLAALAYGHGRVRREPVSLQDSEALNGDGKQLTRASGGRDGHLRWACRLRQSVSRKGRPSSSVRAAPDSARRRRRAAGLRADMTVNRAAGPPSRRAAEQGGPLGHVQSTCGESPTYRGRPWPHSSVCFT